MKKIAFVLVLLCAMLIASAACAGSGTCPTDDAHRYGPWKTKTSATCTRQGHQFKYCQKCDHWEQRHTAKLPHTVDVWTVTKEPTCTEKGRQEGTCTGCNGTIRKSIDMLPHAYGEMVVAKAPTCTQNGRGEYTCKDCGKVKKETIDRLGHDWGEMIVTKDPTCKTTGTGKEACRRCGTERTVKIDRLVHVYDAWTVEKEPEGKTKGTRSAVCTLCGEARTERFYNEGTLYQDMKANEAVIRLQEQLRDLGYYKGNIRSGSFGQLTTEAVERFQKAHGMKGHGVADPQTLEVIESEWNKAFGPKTLDAAEMSEAQEALPLK